MTTEALIQTEPTGSHWSSDKTLEVFQREEAERQRREALEQLPAKERLERERQKLSKLEEELKNKEDAELLKLQELEGYHRLRNFALDHIKRSEWYVQEAQEIPAGVAATLEQFYFEGGHPQLGKDAPPRLAVDLAQRVAAAEFILATHKTWLAKTQARVDELGAKMITLARELKIVDRLPEDLQAKAKQ